MQSGAVTKRSNITFQYNMVLHIEERSQKQNSNKSLYSQNVTLWDNWLFHNGIELY